MQTYQTYEVYIENGNIFPVGEIPQVYGRSKGLVTILETQINIPAAKKTGEERFAAMEKWRGSVRSDIDEKAELAAAREEKYG